MTTMVELAQKLADLAEAEQDAAQALDGVRTVKALTDRDRHLARSSAFLEAARLALKGNG